MEALIVLNGACTFSDHLLRRVARFRRLPGLQEIVRDNPKFER